MLLSELKQTFDILAFVSLYSSWGVFMHCIVEVDAINQGIQNNSFLALHLLQPCHAWTLLHTLHTIAKHIYVEIYTIYMLARHCKNSCLHRFENSLPCNALRCSLSWTKSPPIKDIKWADFCTFFIGIGLLQVLQLSRLKSWPIVLALDCWLQMIQILFVHFFLHRFCIENAQKRLVLNWPNVVY